jgi:hypothetical protein
VRAPLLCISLHQKKEKAHPLRFYQIYCNLVCVVNRLDTALHNDRHIRGGHNGRELGHGTFCGILRLPLKNLSSPAGLDPRLKAAVELTDFGCGPAHSTDAPSGSRSVGI